MLPGVRWSVLLTEVQSGIPALAVTSTLLAAAGLYLAGVRRLARRGRRWPGRHTVSFLAGLAAIWVAVGSGLAFYDDSSVVLHMVQHILLMMAAPPLLALGRPVPLAAQSSTRGVQVRLTRLMRARVVTVLTHPVVAGILYFFTMWVMLVDRQVYDYLVTHQTAHEAGHVLLLAAGLLYWPPLVAPDASRHHLSHPGRVVLLLLSMPLEALPGIWMRFQSTPIAPINTLADTRAGGEVFLVAATGACSLWLVTVVSQWFAFAVREERREQARDSTDLEWTVPAWATGSSGS